MAKTPSTRDAANNVKPTARPKRYPLGARREFEIENRPGWHRAWISDSPTLPGGIQAYLDAGYTFVTDPTKVGEPSVNTVEGVGTAVSRNGGQGITLYLMEIPQEWYDEDRQTEEDARKELEGTMFNPKEGEYGKVKTER